MTSICPLNKPKQKHLIVCLSENAGRRRKPASRSINQIAMTPVSKHKIHRYRPKITTWLPLWPSNCRRRLLTAFRCAYYFFLVSYDVTILLEWYRARSHDPYGSSTHFDLMELKPTCILIRTPGLLRTNLMIRVYYIKKLRMGHQQIVNDPGESVTCRGRASKTHYSLSDNKMSTSKSLARNYRTIMWQLELTLSRDYKCLSQRDFTHHAQSGVKITTFFTE